MAAYRRVYDSRHLQADCQEPGPAPEPYARQLSMGYLNLFYSKIRLHGAAVGESGEAAEYCYEPVCVCVCTNVARISEETTVESLPISPRALPVAVARSSSGGGVAIRYSVLPVLRMTSRLIVFGIGGDATAWCTEDAFRWTDGTAPGSSDDQLSERHC